MIDLTVTDAVATITLDDGKANAMNPSWFAALNEALDRVEADDDAKVVVIAGRDGAFSGGLDLKLLPTLQPEELRDMIVTFGQTMLRVFGFPKPTVAAATGHALGGGTILSMACDHAVAAEGAFRWGLNEVQIGLVVPHWIIAIARSNVAADRLDDVVLPGLIVDPAEAVAIGYADRVASPDKVVEVATEHARTLVPLAHPGYANTKAFLRGDAIEAELARLTPEINTLFGLA